MGLDPIDVDVLSAIGDIIAKLGEGGSLNGARPLAGRMQLKNI